MAQAVWTNPSGNTFEYQTRTPGSNTAEPLLENQAGQTRYVRFTYGADNYDFTLVVGSGQGNWGFRFVSPGSNLNYGTLTPASITRNGITHAFGEVIYHPSADDFRFYYSNGNQNQANVIRPDSITVSDVSLATPAVPTMLTLAAAANTITATWQAVAGATSYSIRYRQTLGGSYQQVDNITMATANITGLAYNTSYQVQVRATNAAGSSDWSTAAAINTGNPPGPTERIHTVGTVPAGFSPPLPPANFSDLYIFHDEWVGHTGATDFFPHPQLLAARVPHEFFAAFRNAPGFEGRVYYQGWLSNMAVAGDDRAYNLQCQILDLNPLTAGANYIGNEFNVPVSGNAVRAQGGNPGATDGIIGFDTQGFSALSTPLATAQDGLAQVYFRDGIPAGLTPTYPALNHGVAGPFRLGVGVEGDSVAGTNGLSQIRRGPTLFLWSRPGKDGLGTAAVTPPQLDAGGATSYPLMVILRVPAVITTATFAIGQPSDLNAVNVGFNTLLSWAHEDSDPIFDVRYKEIGTTEWTQVEARTNSLLVRLPESKRYEFQARAKAPGFLSHWSGSFSFFTPSILLADPTGNGCNIYLLDPDTGARSLAFNLAAVEGQVRLAYRHDTAQLYALDQSGANPTLYEVATANGATTLLARTRIPPALDNGFVREMGWFEGKLYVANSGFTNPVWEITPRAAPANWTARQLPNYTALPGNWAIQGIQQVGDELRFLYEPTGAVSTGQNIVRTFTINPQTGARTNELSFPIATYQDSGVTRADFAASVWHGQRIAILGWRANALGRWQSIDVATGARTDSNIDYSPSTANQDVPWDIASTIPGTLASGFQFFIGGNEVTTDTLSCDIKWGRNNAAYLARVGTLAGQIVVDNESDAYNPLLIRPYTPVAVAYLSGGQRQIICRGFVARVLPTVDFETGLKTTYIHIQGTLGQLQRADYELALFNTEAVRTGQVVESVMRQAGWATDKLKLDAGQVRAHPAFYGDILTAFGVTRTIDVLRSVETAEVGLIHEGVGDELVFLHRFSRELDVRPAQATFGTGPTGIQLIENVKPDDSWSEIRNRIRIGAQDLFTLTDRVVLQYRKDQIADSPLVIPPGADIAFTMTLKDEDNRALRYVRSVASWSALQAGDFAARNVDITGPHNEAINIGTGTSGFYVSVVSNRDMGQSRDIRFINRRGYNVGVTKAELRGRGNSLVGNLTLDIADEASIARFGIKPLDLPTSFVGDALNHKPTDKRDQNAVLEEAKEYASVLLNRYGRPQISGKLMFDPLESQRNEAAMIGLEIGDPVLVSSSTGFPSGGYYVEGKELHTDGETGLAECGIWISSRSRKTVHTDASVMAPALTTSWANVATAVGLTQGRQYVIAARARFASGTPSTNEGHKVLRAVYNQAGRTNLIKVWAEADMPVGDTGQWFAAAFTAGQAQTVAFQQMQRSGGLAVIVDRIRIVDITPPAIT